MLGAFAEQKAAAVASAVGDLHGLLAQGRSATDASFTSLAQAATSADAALKAGPLCCLALFQSHEMLLTM